MKPALATLLSFAILAFLGPSASAPVAAQEAPDERTRPSLFRETLVQDIATAGFYELIGWLETLGLSTRGDRSALAGRLHDFYDLSEEEIAAYAPPATDDPDEPPLVVDSASRTRYFTLEEIDERYIRLSGGVVLTLRDEEAGSVHRVKADEITFNQEHNTLAASGQVVYILERDDSTEQFTGQALTVELDSWEGAFVRGVTERRRTIEGEEIDFSFSGSYITRSRDDVIVLEDGAITSSEADPPHYQIRASKIWVLAPGEWGLRNAFLYVGRVPIFYLPFFFKPGNELFFNPAIGTRSRSGNYIQTTTYLLGTPEEETSPFSLLQLAEDQGPQSEREIEGLFLVPRETPISDAPPPEATVRLLSDVYTKLGAYVALDAQLPELGPLEQVDFYLALAASRHIYVTDYPGAGSAYTPYLVTDGEAVQSWNTSRIGPLTLPLRFGTELSLRTSFDQLSASLRFEYYSDRRFLSDFEERSEQIDWLGLLGQGTPTTQPGPISSLIWQIDASYRADTTDIPWISQLSLQRALVSLNWRSRTIPATLLPDDARLADSSPEASFFYPDSLRAPELSATISGTIFEFPGRPRPARDEEEDDREELIPPWREGEEEQRADALPSAPSGPFRLPEPQPALPSPQLPQPIRADLGYSFAPTLIVDRTYHDDDWEQPSDVDFSVAYGGASARLTGSLGYGAGFSADALRLDGSLSASGQYRTVFDRNPDLPDARWESLRLQAWDFTSFSTRNNLTITAQPLRELELWSASSLSYTADVVLYRVVFDSVVGGDPTWLTESIAWDEEFIRRHQLQATAQLELRERQSLQVTAALPPLDERYSGRLSLRVAPLSLSLSAGVRRPEEELVYDPINGSAALSPWENVTLSDSLTYDVENERVTNNTTALNAGPLSAEFEMQTSEGYTFGGPGIGWEAEGEERLRPSSASIGVSLDSDFEPWWKNRIVAAMGAELSWSSSLTRFTESSLRFGFTGSLLIHRFLRMSIQTASSNSQSYVYIDPLAREVGREPRNVLVDLLRSFNFFNRQDRLESGFNLQSIRFDAIHDLGDWDLTIGYRGSPQLQTAPDGTRSYEWRGSLDITLQWRPIAELSTSIRVDEEDISFGDDS
jgi:hypothetical protein